MDDATPKVPYGKRYWYDHMAAGDSPIWERFIEQNPEAFDTVQYDFPVGTIPDHATEAVVEGGGRMGKLYQRKIDVVGNSTQIVWIIEVKPQASNSTVGQVLGYLHLYERDVKPDRETRAAIVCGAIDRDAREFAEAQGVAIHVV